MTEMAPWLRAGTAFRAQHLCRTVYGTPIGTQCPHLVSMGDCSHMHKPTHTQFKNTKIKFKKPSSYGLQNFLLSYLNFIVIEELVKACITPYLTVMTSKVWKSEGPERLWDRIMLSSLCRFTSYYLYTLSLLIGNYSCLFLKKTKRKITMSPLWRCRWWEAKRRSLGNEDGSQPKSTWRRSWRGAGRVPESAGPGRSWDTSTWRSWCPVGRELSVRSGRNWKW